MAERRMFKKTTIRSAKFMQLSRAAIGLYLFLCLEADDDGFVENAAAVGRSCKCTKKHLQELEDGGWVIPFESGVVAITHWHLHNKIPKDRFRPTDFQKEYASLRKDKQGVYTKCIQVDNNLYTQDRIDQDSLEKDNIGKDRIEKDMAEHEMPAASSFLPPVAADDDFIDSDFDRILGFYQSACPNLEPCEALTPALREKIRRCDRAGFQPSRLPVIFMKANASLFLRGDNMNNWTAGLGWLMEPEHLQAVEDGKYDTWA